MNIAHIQSFARSAIGAHWLFRMGSWSLVFAMKAFSETGGEM